MKNNQMFPCVLTVAGSDPSGGGGIQADIKAISATGGYAASVITVLTAQNTQGVTHVHSIPASVLAKQLQAVLCDLNIKAIKIGMVFNKKNIDVIACELDKYKQKKVVLDPVMVSKNGCELLKSSVISHMKRHLFSHCYLITPNIPEAEKLLGYPIQNDHEMQAAARILGEEFHTNILIKGGHLQENTASDVLYSIQDNTCHWYKQKRVESQHTHGTGCTLSAAIACYLAQGFTLYAAIFAAKKYLTQAIESGKHLKIGHGVGPVHHFYYQESNLS